MPTQPTVAADGVRYSRQHPRPRYRVTPITASDWLSIPSGKSSEDPLTPLLESEYRLLRLVERAQVLDRSERARADDALWECQAALDALLRVLRSEAGRHGFGGRALHPHHLVALGRDWLRRDPTGMWLPAVVAWLSTVLLLGHSPALALATGIAWLSLIALRPLGVWTADRSWPAGVGVAFSALLLVQAGAEPLSVAAGWLVALVAQAILAGRLCHTPLDDLRHALIGGAHTALWWSLGLALGR